jgi:hypothetical protein
MTEKEIYELHNKILILTGQLYHLVPNTEESRKASMHHCYYQVEEAISNMARMASASQEIILS